MQTKNSRPVRFRRYYSVPIVDITPAAPPMYLRPTYDNPVIGERPFYFPDNVQTVGCFGVVSLWYYDEFGRPTLEYGDPLDHRIGNIRNNKKE